MLNTMILTADGKKHRKCNKHNRVEQIQDDVSDTDEQSINCIFVHATQLIERWIPIRPVDRVDSIANAGDGEEAEHQFRRWEQANDDELNCGEHKVVGLVVEEVLDNAIAPFLKVAEVGQLKASRFEREVVQATQRRKLEVIQSCLTHLDVSLFLAIIDFHQKLGSN